MRTTERCRGQWARAPWAPVAVAALMVAGIALAWAPGAQAQTSCSSLITLSPSAGQNPPGDVLTPGAPNNVITIGVSILQTCLTNGVPQAANVTGTTRVDVACATSANLNDPSGTGCAAAEQLNTLQVTGCSADQPGVSCVAANDGNGNPTIAEIIYTNACPNPPGGNECREVPFGTPFQLATITATTVPGNQVFSPASGEFAVTASTGGSNVFTDAAAASSQGSAPEFYPAPSPTFTVDKGCAATWNAGTQSVDVTFTATVANPDTFEAVNYICADSTGASLSNNPGQAAANGGTAELTGTYNQTGLSASDTITCTGVGATTGFDAGTETADATCLAVTSPSIIVVKGDGTTPGPCVIDFNQANQNFDVSFTATLTNNGNENLTNITCSDSPAAALTGVPGSLAVGQSAVIHGTYTQAGASATDTITCDGVGATSNTVVSTNSVATCQTTVVPTATLAKTCSATLNAQGNGVDVSFTATLSNTGPETITGIACTDTPSAALAGVPGSLTPGSSATITGTYSTTGSSASDTLSCDGAGGVSGTSVSPAASATCTPITTRSLSVTKQCTTDGATVSFSGAVTNTGTEQLNNVACTDDQGGTVNGVPSTLAPGQVANYTGSYASAANPAVDTVTCVGTGAVSGQTTSNNATASCTPPVSLLGCRITAGGITPVGGNGNDKDKATYGGQVGAPCGCIGAFDTFDNIEGNWTHMRKAPGTGSFHATGFNSLVCGCDPTTGADGLGVFGDLTGFLTGQLCNPRDRDTGPFPPNAPANLACFTGVGGFNPTSGPRTVDVAFRVEVEDRSQPGGGNNSGPTPSVYRIRIWIPTGAETAEGLAELVACTGPLSSDFCPNNIRPPDIDDGQDLIHGVIQIHPQIPKHVDICPVPDETCPQPLMCSDR